MKTRRTWRTQVNSPRSGLGPRIGRWLAVAAGTLRGRRGWAVGSAAVIVLGLLGVWLFAAGGESGPPDPRARQYKDVDACLRAGCAGHIPKPLDLDRFLGTVAAVLKSFPTS